MALHNNPIVQSEQNKLRELESKELGERFMNVGKPKCVLCYSGGLDSTVLLYQLRKEGYDVHCLSVNYGQRHDREVNHALRLCKELNVDFRTIYIDLKRTVLLDCKSSQINDSVPVPDGHYTDETMKATIVPNRNMILLSLATALAISLKAPIIAYAAHAGDHAIYPDCRPEFVVGMAAVIRCCDWYKPDLITPFLDRSKADIVKLGAELGVPFEKTYSCYKGGEKHCGRCGTCVERRESFQLAGIPDPTEYE